MVFLLCSGRVESCIYRTFVEIQMNKSLNYMQGIHVHVVRKDRRNNNRLVAGIEVSSLKYSNQHTQVHKITIGGNQGYDFNVLRSSLFGVLPQSQAVQLLLMRTRAHLYNEGVRPGRDHSLGGDVLCSLSTIPILAEA